jgi:hypothetical protein
MDALSDVLRVVRLNGAAASLPLSMAGALALRFTISRRAAAPCDGFLP